MEIKQKKKRQGMEVGWGDVVWRGQGERKGKEEEEKENDPFAN
jgi:hypothetical protein